MRLLKIRENTGADLCGGSWPAEEEPLDLIAVDCVEKRCLRRVFYTFDRDPHVQLASKCDNRFHHRSCITAAAFEALHEAPVDLDLGDIDTAAADSLKVLDPKRPIGEAEMAGARSKRR